MGDPHVPPAEEQPGLAVTDSQHSSAPASPKVAPFDEAALLQRMFWSVPENGLPHARRPPHCLAVDGRPEVQVPQAAPRSRSPPCSAPPRCCGSWRRAHHGDKAPQPASGKANPYRRPKQPVLAHRLRGRQRRRAASLDEDQRLAHCARVPLCAVERGREAEDRPLRPLCRHAQGAVGDAGHRLQRAPRKPNAPRSAYVQATVRQIRDCIAFAKASTLSTLSLADAERFVAEIPEQAQREDAGPLRGRTTRLRRLAETHRPMGPATRSKGCRPALRRRTSIECFKRVGFRFEEAENAGPGCVVALRGREGARRHALSPRSRRHRAGPTGALLVSR
jgi:hypothetical protein